MSKRNKDNFCKVEPDFLRWKARAEISTPRRTIPCRRSEKRS